MKWIPIKEKKPNKSFDQILITYQMDYKYYVDLVSYDATGEGSFASPVRINDETPHTAPKVVAWAAPISINNKLWIKTKVKLPVKNYDQDTLLIAKQDNDKVKYEFCWFCATNSEAFAKRLGVESPVEENTFGYLAGSDMKLEWASIENVVAWMEMPSPYLPPRPNPETYDKYKSDSPLKAFLENNEFEMGYRLHSAKDEANLYKNLEALAMVLNYDKTIDVYKLSDGSRIIKLRAKERVPEEYYNADTDFSIGGRRMVYGKPIYPEDRYDIFRKRKCIVKNILFDYDVAKLLYDDNTLFDYTISWLPGYSRSIVRGYWAHNGADI